MLYRTSQLGSPRIVLLNLYICIVITQEISCWLIYPQFRTVFIHTSVHINVSLFLKIIFSNVIQSMQDVMLVTG